MNPPRTGPMLRSLLAPNALPMTLDGTRTYLVGTNRIAVIDPGPDSPQHLDAIAGAIGGGVVVAIILTHEHPDHAAGAGSLARRTGAPVRAAVAGTLSEGDVVPTDAGELRAIATPGHTPDHFAMHWPAERAIFCGDLMMGGLDTALVAPPEGNLRDYLASLDRLHALDAAVLHPAHGPDFTDPQAAIGRYRDHRESRLNAVRQALTSGARTRDALFDAVYGTTVPAEMRPFAEAALSAYTDYLLARGEIASAGPDESWAILPDRGKGA